MTENLWGATHTYTHTLVVYLNEAVGPKPFFDLAGPSLFAKWHRLGHLLQPARKGSPHVVFFEQGLQNTPRQQIARKEMTLVALHCSLAELW